MAFASFEGACMYRSSKEKELYRSGWQGGERSSFLIVNEVLESYMIRSYSASLLVLRATDNN